MYTHEIHDELKCHAPIILSNCLLTQVVHFSPTRKCTQIHYILLCCKYKTYLRGSNYKHVDYVFDAIAMTLPKLQAG